MAVEILGTDLFGDPILAAKEGPGRPEVEWNRQTSLRVSLAFTLGWTVKRVAKLVGLSCPTLRKVYFSECGERALARDKHELRQLALLAEQAEEGAVSASKELDKRLEKLRTRDLGERVADRGRRAEPKAAPKGKKDQEKDAARGVGGRFGTREPPARLMN